MTGVPKVKICGVTRPDDAAHIAAAGADFLGLNFWPTSKRFLPPPRASLVAGAARSAGRVSSSGPVSSVSSIQIVGVFVNAALDEIVSLARDVALDVIQLHGDESPDTVTAVAIATQLPVWKAVSATASELARLDAWPVDALLLDAPSRSYGGSGTSFDWNLARAARDQATRKLVLAGGLTPDNIAAAIDAVEPWAVDVASGVESAPGIKDPLKVTAFVSAVRARSVARRPKR
jgi:phosphoribosylanthranilate isomerase